MHVTVDVIKIAVRHPVPDADRRHRIEAGVDPPARRRLTLFFRHPVVKREHFRFVGRTDSVQQEPGTLGKPIHPDFRNGGRLHMTHGLLRYLSAQFHIAGKFLRLEYPLKPVQFTNLGFDQGAVNILVPLLRNVRHDFPKPRLLTLTANFRTFSGSGPNIEHPSLVIPYMQADLKGLRGRNRIPEGKTAVNERIHGHSP